jgi:hypothetical protein
VVQVAHRGLDVGVPHPCLDLDDRGTVDRQRAEGVAQVVEPQRPDAGLVACRDVATAKRGGVDVTALLVDETRSARPT